MIIWLQEVFYGRDKPFKVGNFYVKMKRGKNLLIFGILFFIFASISNVLAIDLDISTPSLSTGGGSFFTITGLRYEPYPVGPGEQFDLWAKVENKGASETRNATCVLKIDYPFSLYQGSLTNSYGKLGSGESTVFQFRLQVDQKAVQGSNELQLWCTEDPSSNVWKIQKIGIMVQTRYSTLNIKNIKTDPAIVPPGKEAKLLITLENFADSAMKDLNVKLDLSTVSIAPSGEVAEKKIRVLESGGVADLIFNIKALPDAKGGIYKMPFTLTYSDNLGKQYNQTGFIGVEVSSKPELQISVDSTTISKSQKIGEASIKIVNSGLTDLKFATAEILPSENFKLLSSNVVYISDIDSDDFGTATFKLSVKTNKDFEIPLKLSFRDSLNNEYTENVNVPFSMLSPSEMGQKSIYGTLIPVLVVILALLFIFIRRFRERVISIFKKK